MSIRLNKWLALNGIASRRKSDQLILDGAISINGQICKELGTKIDPHNDVVLVNGKAVQDILNRVYIMLNKPTRVLSTTKDNYGRNTVVDLVDLKTRVFPVGRLDYNSQGLILLTDDGSLAYKLTHPRFHIPKTYLLEIKGLISSKEVNRFARGIWLDDGLSRPVRVMTKEFDRQNGKTILEVILNEGRKRQLRRMCQTLGWPLLKLERIQIGPLALGDLKQGAWRYLSETEINLLKNSLEHDEY